MDYLKVPNVVQAELIRDGVMITFADGLCAVFPSSLLYASHQLATIMSEEDCRAELGE